MEYGYARVSSKDQNLARQIEELKACGIDERYIYTDMISGKKFDRPKYNLLVGTEQSAPMLREGDLLVICSIDRLGRDYEEIRNQWQYITKQLGVDIRVVDMPLLDTRSHDRNNLDKSFVSDLVLQILSYVAEKERESTRSRQRAGIDCMRTDPVTGKKIGKSGRPTGRPSAEYPENWESVYFKWKNNEITATAAMKQLGLKRNTFYNLLRKFEQKASNAQKHCDTNDSLFPN